MSTRVFVEQLPERTTGEFLYCWKCGGEYSAMRGDYFWMGNQPFTCDGVKDSRHRKVNLQLVRCESWLVPA